ncbi:hypothetical protein SDRG_15514 [Saprolegnia diclina VS20]|uniref:Uncharacterized protein n=1 Tax=Saprolegnia diclina (strain VS20) TaxID=1156394 RepID=T0PWQ3_SAPDV|nr:hypothetical protein SDRG_15514 [Saprolegnia diclina VS20]EQC26676.1 hypothetical protein SDRG_15514 [Saprolegnia diclina VS20]|eukprot:XP_008619911.1 hypothetical protein SDRG_15514 [Saprolegnia diclina VS20]
MRQHRPTTTGGPPPPGFNFNLDHAMAGMHLGHGRPAPHHEPPMKLEVGIVVQPTTTPNQSIRVAVTLPAQLVEKELSLVMGLFRAGHANQNRPIFLRSLQFDLRKRLPLVTTRLQVKAPKTIGEFEFRAFNEDAGPDIIFASSGPLKVLVDEKYWNEALETLGHRIEAAAEAQDVGLIVSAVLGLLRVVEVLPTAFPSQASLFGMHMEHLLSLVFEVQTWDMENEESLDGWHGAIRTLLHVTETNRYVWESLVPSVQKLVAMYQSRLYCGVSDRYFETVDAKQEYWQAHLGLPLRDSVAPWAPGFEHALSTYLHAKSEALIPNVAEFTAVRQSIFERVSGVVSALSFQGHRVGLDVFGSSNNFFGTKDSDMDMCLVLPTGVELSPIQKQEMLKALVEKLDPELFTDIDTGRLTARIPIVMFKDATSGIDCDICVENALALRNTRLLRTYALADPRVRILAYFVKYWVKTREMNNAAQGTLSSYGYLLLLIHYLQRTSPPVLPVLQTLPPQWQGEIWCRCYRDETETTTDPSATCPYRPCMLKSRDQADGPRLPHVAFGDAETYFFDPVHDEHWHALRSFGAWNRSSVGSLLLGFFKYYGDVGFDYAHHVVSVRMGRTLLKAEKPQWKQHHRLAIEDPFELDYDVAHVVKGARFKYVRQQLARAYWLCVQANMDGYGIDEIMDILCAPIEHKDKAADDEAATDK